MHSLFARSSAFFTHFTTVGAILFGTIAALTYLIHPSPAALKYSYKVANVFEFAPIEIRHHQTVHFGSDRARFLFDLNADFTPYFGWNVKQLFVYIVAHYNSTDEGGSLQEHKIVVWDKIMKDSDKKVLNLKNHQCKYGIIDNGNKLRGKQITFSLQWQVIPHVGILYTQVKPLPEAKIDLPKKYFAPSHSSQYSSIPYEDDDFDI